MDRRDELRVHVLKDVLIAGYQTRAAKLSALQGGGLGGFALAAVAFLTGQVTVEAFSIAGAVALGVAVVATLLAQRDEAEFEEQVRELLRETRNFKP